jgi:hypothetical protein
VPLVIPPLGAIAVGGADVPVVGAALVDVVPCRGMSMTLGDALCQREKRGGFDARCSSSQPAISCEEATRSKTATGVTFISFVP